MRLCSLLVLLTSLVPRPEQSDDKQLLQGTWKVVTAVTAVPESAKLFEGLLFTIRGDRIQMYRADVPQESLRFVLDPDKQPKQIDLYGNDGGANPKVPLLGIYAIDGDRLRLAWSKIDGKDRPLSFALPAGRHRQVSLVLERVKAK